MAVLVFDRSRETGGANENRKNVLFIYASREFEPAKSQNNLTAENIEKITTTYRERKEIEKYSHLATPEEIAENDYNLNIPRYVDTFEEEEEIDIKALQSEINQLKNELVNVRTKMDRYLKELGVA